MATQALTCHFPATGKQSGGPKRPLSARVELKRLDLLQDILAQENGGRAFSNVICAAWALSLRCYTGLNEVCFGFEEVGNSLRAGADDGSSLVAMMRIDENMLLNDLVRQGDDEKCILPETHGNFSFNTSILLRRGATAPSTKQSPNSPSVMSDKVSFCLRSPAALCLQLSQCQIRLLVKVLKSGISVFLEYRNSFIPTEQAKNVASTVDQILSNILVSPTLPVGQADFLSDRNRLQIEKWNSKPLPNVKRTIHEIIYENVLKSPDAEAICSWDGNLSYQELDTLACQLAAHLISLGVGPETIVPLCFDKSKWNNVALVAVLYAGGACKLCFVVPCKAPCRSQQFGWPAQITVLTSALFVTRRFWI